MLEIYIKYENAIVKETSAKIQDKNDHLKEEIKILNEEN